MYIVIVGGDRKKLLFEDARTLRMLLGHGPWTRKIDHLIYL